MSQIPDKKLDLLVQRLQQDQSSLAGLEVEYKDKLRGNLYEERKRVLESRIQALKRRIEGCGRTVNLICVSGKRLVRISSGVEAEVDYAILLTDVHPEDAVLVVRTLLEGIISANTMDVPLGEPNVKLVFQ